MSRTCTLVLAFFTQEHLGKKYISLERMNSSTKNTFCSSKKLERTIKYIFSNKKLDTDEKFEKQRKKYLSKKPAAKGSSLNDVTRFWIIFDPPSSH